MNYSRVFSSETANDAGTYISRSARPQESASNDLPFSGERRTIAASVTRPRGGYTRRMIHGAHVIIYSKDSEADRAFFRDVLKYESVDAGHGWLIFALPPAEVAVHPSEGNDVHELFLMCDDVQAFIAEMKKKEV